MQMRALMRIATFALEQAEIGEIPLPPLVPISIIVHWHILSRAEQRVGKFPTAIALVNSKAAS